MGNDLSRAQNDKLESLATLMFNTTISSSTIITEIQTIFPKPQSIKNTLQSLSTDPNRYHLNPLQLATLSLRIDIIQFLLEYFQSQPLYPIVHQSRSIIPPQFTDYKIKSHLCIDTLDWLTNIDILTQEHVRIFTLLLPIIPPTTNARYFVQLLENLLSKEYTNERIDTIAVLFSFINIGLNIPQPPIPIYLSDLWFQDQPIRPYIASKTNNNTTTPTSSTKSKSKFATTKITPITPSIIPPQPHPAFLLDIYHKDYTYMTFSPPLPTSIQIPFMFEYQQYTSLRSQLHPIDAMNHSPLHHVINPLYKRYDTPQLRRLITLLHQQYSHPLLFKQLYATFPILYNTDLTTSDMFAQRGWRWAPNDNQYLFLPIEWFRPIELDYNHNRFKSIFPTTTTTTSKRVQNDNNKNNNDDNNIYPSFDCFQQYDVIRNYWQSIIPQPHNDCIVDGDINTHIITKNNNKNNKINLDQTKLTTKTIQEMKILTEIEQEVEYIRSKLPYLSYSQRFLPKDIPLWISSLSEDNQRIIYIQLITRHYVMNRINTNIINYKHAYDNIKPTKELLQSEKNIWFNPKVRTSNDLCNEQSYDNYAATRGTLHGVMKLKMIDFELPINIDNYIPKNTLFYTSPNLRESFDSNHIIPLPQDDTQKNDFIPYILDIADKMITSSIRINGTITDSILTSPFYKNVTPFQTLLYNDYLVHLDLIQFIIHDYTTLWYQSSTSYNTTNTAFDIMTFILTIYDYLANHNTTRLNNNNNEPTNIIQIAKNKKLTIDDYKRFIEQCFYSILSASSPWKSKKIKKLYIGNKNIDIAKSKMFRPIKLINMSQKVTNGFNPTTTIATSITSTTNNNNNNDNIDIQINNILSQTIPIEPLSLQDTILSSIRPECEPFVPFENTTSPIKPTPISMLFSSLTTPITTTLHTDSSSSLTPISQSTIDYISQFESKLNVIEHLLLSPYLSLTHIHSQHTHFPIAAHRQINRSKLYDKQHKINIHAPWFSYYYTLLNKDVLEHNSKGSLQLDIVPRMVKNGGKMISKHQTFFIQPFTSYQYNYQDNFWVLYFVHLMTATSPSNTTQNNNNYNYLYIFLPLLYLSSTPQIFTYNLFSLIPTTHERIQISTLFTKQLITQNDLYQSLLPKLLNYIDTRITSISDARYGSSHSLATLHYYTQLYIHGSPYQMIIPPHYSQYLQHFQPKKPSPLPTPISFPPMRTFDDIPNNLPYYEYLTYSISNSPYHRLPNAPSSSIFNTDIKNGRGTNNTNTERQLFEYNYIPTFFGLETFLYYIQSSHQQLPLDLKHKPLTRIVHEHQDINRLIIAEQEKNNIGTDSTITMNEKGYYRPPTRIPNQKLKHTMLSLQFPTFGSRIWSSTTTQYFLNGFFELSLLQSIYKSIRLYLFNVDDKMKLKKDNTNNNNNNNTTNDTTTTTTTTSSSSSSTTTTPQPDLSSLPYITPSPTTIQFVSQLLPLFIQANTIENRIKLSMINDKAGNNNIYQTIGYEVEHHVNHKDCFQPRKCNASPYRPRNYLFIPKIDPSVVQFDIEHNNKHKQYPTRDQIDDFNRQYLYLQQNDNVNDDNIINNSRRKLMNSIQNGTKLKAYKYKPNIDGQKDQHVLTNNQTHHVTTYDPKQQEQQQKDDDIEPYIPPQQNNNVQKDDYIPPTIKIVDVEQKVDYIPPISNQNDDIPLPYHSPSSPIEETTTNSNDTTTTPTTTTTTPNDNNENMIETTTTTTTPPNDINNDNQSIITDQLNPNYRIPSPYGNNYESKDYRNYVCAGVPLPPKEPEPQPPAPLLPSQLSSLPTTKTTTTTTGDIDSTTTTTTTTKTTTTTDPITTTTTTSSSPQHQSTINPFYMRDLLDVDIIPTMHYAVQCTKSLDKFDNTIIFDSFTHHGYHYYQPKTILQLGSLLPPDHIYWTSQQISLNITQGNDINTQQNRYTNNNDNNNKNPSIGNLLEKRHEQKIIPGTNEQRLQTYLRNDIPLPNIEYQLAQLYPNNTLPYQITHLQFNPLLLFQIINLLLRRLDENLYHLGISYIHNQEQTINNQNISNITNNNNNNNNNNNINKIDNQSILTHTCIYIESNIIINTIHYIITQLTNMCLYLFSTGLIWSYLSEFYHIDSITSGGIRSNTDKSYTETIRITDDNLTLKKIDVQHFIGQLQGLYHRIYHIKVAYNNYYVFTVIYNVLGMKDEKLHMNNNPIGSIPIPQSITTHILQLTPLLQQFITSFTTLQTTLCNLNQTILTYIRPNTIIPRLSLSTFAPTLLSSFVKIAERFIHRLRSFSDPLHIYFETCFDKTSTSMHKIPPLPFVHDKISSSNQYHNQFKSESNPQHYEQLQYDNINPPLFPYLPLLTETDLVEYHITWFIYNMYIMNDVRFFSGNHLTLTQLTAPSHVSSPAAHHNATCLLHFHRYYSSLQSKAPFIGSEKVFATDMKSNSYDQRIHTILETDDNTVEQSIMNRLHNEVNKSNHSKSNTESQITIKQYQAPPHRLGFPTAIRFIPFNPYFLSSLLNSNDFDRQHYALAISNLQLDSYIKLATDYQYTHQRQCIRFTRDYNRLFELNATKESFEIHKLDKNRIENNIQKDIVNNPVYTKDGDKLGRSQLYQLYWPSYGDCIHIIDIFIMYQIYRPMFPNASILNPFSLFKLNTNAASQQQDYSLSLFSSVQNIQSTKSIRTLPQHGLLWWFILTIPQTLTSIDNIDTIVSLLQGIEIDEKWINIIKEENDDLSPPYVFESLGSYSSCPIGQIPWDILQQNTRHMNQYKKKLLLYNPNYIDSSPSSKTMNQQQKQQSQPPQRTGLNGLFGVLKSALSTGITQLAQQMGGYDDDDNDNNDNDGNDKPQKPDATHLCLQPSVMRRFPIMSQFYDSLPLLQNEGIIRLVNTTTWQDTLSLSMFLTINDDDNGFNSNNNNDNNNDLANNDDDNLNNNNNHIQNKQNDQNGVKTQKLITRLNQQLLLYPIQSIYTEILDSIYQHDPNTNNHINIHSILADNNNNPNDFTKQTTKKTIEDDTKQETLLDRIAQYTRLFIRQPLRININPKSNITFNLNQGIIQITTDNNNNNNNNNIVNDDDDNDNNNNNIPSNTATTTTTTTTTTTATNHTPIQIEEITSSTSFSSNEWSDDDDNLPTSSSTTTTTSSTLNNVDHNNNNNNNIITSFLPKQGSKIEQVKTLLSTIPTTYGITLLLESIIRRSDAKLLALLINTIGLDDIISFQYQPIQRPIWPQGSNNSTFDDSIKQDYEQSTICNVLTYMNLAQTYNYAPEIYSIIQDAFHIHNSE